MRKIIPYFEQKNNDRFSSEMMEVRRKYHVFQFYPKILCSVEVLFRDEGQIEESSIVEKLRVFGASGSTLNTANMRPRKVKLKIKRGY